MRVPLLAVSEKSEMLRKRTAIVHGNALGHAELVRIGGMAALQVNGRKQSRAFPLNATP